MSTPNTHIFFEEGANHKRSVKEGDKQRDAERATKAAQRKADKAADKAQKRAAKVEELERRIREEEAKTAEAKKGEAEAKEETERLKKAASDAADSGSYTSHMAGGMPGDNDGGSVGSRASTKLFGKGGALTAAAGGLPDGDFPLHQPPEDLVEKRKLSPIVFLKYTKERVIPISTDGFAGNAYKESTFSLITKQMERDSPQKVPEEERPAYWEAVRNKFRMNYAAVEQEKEEQKKEKPRRYANIQTVDGLTDIFTNANMMGRE